MRSSSQRVFKGLLVYIKLSLCFFFHHSLNPENNDFISYIYILYFQSTIHYFRLHFLMFRSKYCQTEVLEQPVGGTPSLYVLTIREQPKNVIG